MRKQYNKDFKFKVALEAVKGDKTVSEIVSLYQISSSLVHKWKRQLLTQGNKVFNSHSTSSPSTTIDVEKLHATIGRLKVENDFLSKVLSN